MHSYKFPWILGRNIRLVRRDRGLTQGQLADKAHISRIALGTYERGERTPPVDICLQIANALNISMDDLTKKELEKECPERYIATFRSRKLTPEEYADLVHNLSILVGSYVTLEECGKQRKGRSGEENVETDENQK